MSRPRIGLALGSGAARGWAHIGVIEALREAEIKPDIICGTSMGALVGAAYVTGALDELRAFAEALTRRGVVKLLDVGMSGGGLINGAAILELLRNLGVKAPIEEGSIPFAAVATNLESGRETWLREGEIDHAVRASISIPGIFKPAQHGNAWLIDGALVNPVPVSLCRAMDAGVIIAVHVNSKGLVKFSAKATVQQESAPDFLLNLIEQMPSRLRAQTEDFATGLFRPPPVTPGYFEVLLNALNIMEDLITRSRLAGEPPDFLLTPNLEHIGPLEFHRAKEAIEAGYLSMQQALPALKKLVS